MAITYSYETEVLTMVKALLTASSITNYTDGEDLGTSAIYPSVAVEVSNIGNSIIKEKGLPTGFENVDIQLSCQSYIDDDLDYSAVNTLAGQVREIFYNDRIIENLNSQVGNISFINMSVGDTFKDNDLRLRVVVLQFNLIFTNYAGSV